MQLFQNNSDALTPLEKESFKLEKDIQALVESNMEALFGLELVSSEFVVGGFRLDSLAFNEQSNSFVIIEYKKGHSYSVVDQGFSYLSVMVNNKADFILEYNEKTNKQLKRTNIDWASSRVIFVSPSFNTYQKNSVNFSDVPFELWEIKRFEGGLIALEQYESSSRESIEKLSKDNNKSVITRVSSEVKVLSEEDHVSKLDPSMKPVWTSFKDRFENFSDTSFGLTKSYLSWKRDKTVICYISFYKKELQMSILQGTKKKTGEKSKGFFIADDPKKLTRERTWKYKSGDIGSEYKISITKQDQLDYVMFLLEQKYNSMG